MNLVTMNNTVMVLYYLISAFFLIAIVRNFVKSKDPQEAVLFSIVMIPFVLRILRLK